MKKYLYELTEKELDENINKIEIQRLIEFTDSYKKPCNILLDSYCACIKMKVLLEQQIEVGNND